MRHATPEELGAGPGSGLEAPRQVDSPGPSDRPLQGRHGEGRPPDRTGVPRQGPFTPSRPPYLPQRVYSPECTPPGPLSGLRLVYLHKLYSSFY